MPYFVKSVHEGGEGGLKVQNSQKSVHGVYGKPLGEKSMYRNMKRMTSKDIDVIEKYCRKIQLVIIFH